MSGEYDVACQQGMTCSQTDLPATAAQEPGQLSDGDRAPLPIGLFPVGQVARIWLPRQRYFLRIDEKGD